MKLNNPITDYVVKSTFPTSGEVTAIEGSGIDFVKKSTMIIEQSAHWQYYVGGTPATRGARVSASGNSLYWNIVVLPSPWVLTNMYMRYINADNPCHLSIFIQAGALNEAYNREEYIGSDREITSPYGANLVSELDLLPDIPNILPGDSVSGGFNYSSTVTDSNIYINGVYLRYTL